MSSSQPQWASLVAQMVKSLPARQREAQVRSLGGEDPLEQGMATHSSLLAWEIPWIEEAGGIQSVYRVTKESNRMQRDIIGHT